MTPLYRQPRSYGFDVTPIAPRYLDSGAAFSECGLYRYRLRRRWRATGRPVCFILLNPSTANAEQDDPTIRRCVNFARSWGRGAIEIVNLFAWRATDPRDLRRAADPVGSDNDSAILAAIRAADLLVVAWGNHGAFLDRDRHVVALLASQRLGRKAVRCFGPTSAGQPRHPLRLNRTTALMPMALTPETTGTATIESSVIRL